MILGLGDGRAFFKMDPISVFSVWSSVGTIRWLGQVSIGLPEVQNREVQAPAMAWIAVPGGIGGVQPPAPTLWLYRAEGSRGGPGPPKLNKNKAVNFSAGACQMLEPFQFRQHHLQFNEPASMESNCTSGAMNWTPPGATPPGKPWKPAFTSIPNSLREFIQLERRNKLDILTVGQQVKENNFQKENFIL